MPRSPPRPLPANRRGATVSGQRTVAETVAAAATGQHGLVTTEQLHATGLSDGGLRHWVRTGRLHRVHRGVYAVGHAALSPQGRRMAVVLACGRGAVLSHTTAAELWGLRNGSSSRWHVTVPGMSGGRGTSARRANAARPTGRPRRPRT
jgi:predicted transcriptional regulator of viral defense system